MSKVKYYYVEEYVCSCLEQLRKMDTTGDYSQLLAVTERIQAHVNAMEAGLGKGWRTREILYDKDKKAEETVDRLKKLWPQKDVEDF